MSRTITVTPLTRIEGHARITLTVDDAGQLSHARFHVEDFRGFEAFCEGRLFSEMGAITARICGICPVSHQLAAARCGDKLLALEVPAAAQRLRLLVNLAQICQSHALSFFHLSSPDWLLGWQSDPARRNLFGLIAADPELARAGIGLRRFGQELIERLAGRRLHARWLVPGGVLSALSSDDRLAILAQLPAARAAAALALDRFVPLLDGVLSKELVSFGTFESLFMALVHPDGRWSCLGGSLRVVDSSGVVVADGLSEDNYANFLAELSLGWTYLKSPYYRPWGHPAGIYRVGPLARLNVCSTIGTPHADRELQRFRTCHGSAASGGRIVTASFAYHHARLVEIVAVLEAIEALLQEPAALEGPLQAHGPLAVREAVGVSEAPRGTLFHHYRVDRDGVLEHVNLLIATGQNNLAMNRTIEQIARTWIPWPLQPGQLIDEPLLNRLEAGIRCFDPCLSCSTHALGQMPLRVELRTSNGQLLAQGVRS
jgi:NAD-reducing hydrogenase large subunit